MKIFSIATIAVVMSGFAYAAEEPAVKPVSHTTAEQEGKPIGTPVETSGKVMSIHSVPMVGTTAPHTIVKIETEQGDTDIVDLGSAEELKTNGIEPKEGKQLWVDGRVGTINDKFLIVAERLSESKLVQITRTSDLTEETVKHADKVKTGSNTTADQTTNERKDVNATQPASEAKDPQAPKTETVDANQKARTVAGKVVHTRHVRIEGEADEHVIAKIQTESGIAVIDLGTCPAMPNNVNLTDGQTIFATGFVGQLNGKPIILADSVGNTSTIQRPALATTQTK